MGLCSILWQRPWSNGWKINCELITIKLINKEYAPILLRITISGIFLWFGINQIIYTDTWIGWLPIWIVNFPIEPNTFLIINGVFETIFGILLFLGLFTRLTSLILAIHLLGITFTIGYNDIGVRDLGLSLATLSIFFFGADKWSLDKILKSKCNNRLTRLLYIFDEQ